MLCERKALVPAGPECSLQREGAAALRLSDHHSDTALSLAVDEAGSQLAPGSAGTLGAAPEQLRLPCDSVWWLCSFRAYDMQREGCGCHIHALSPMWEVGPGPSGQVKWPADTLHEAGGRPMETRGARPARLWRILTGWSDLVGVHEGGP